MNTRAGFTTRWGFYLAAVGSALGLGNLWRFPYVVGENGGGAFLLMYVVATVLIGLPLLCAELILGKTTRQSAVGALEVLTAQGRSKSSLVWFGKFSIVASVLLLSYYTVVCGWVLHFCMQYFVGVFIDGPVQGADIYLNLMTSGWLQLGLTSVHLILCAAVVAKGVERGLERWVGIIMPIFVIFLLYLIFESTQLSGTTEAIRFLFYPDFSKIDFGSAIKAIGHVLFTLSLGFGAMIVFGSYMKSTMNVPEAAIRVVALDTVISLCVGMLIFPIVFSGGIRPDTGPTILFETIPMLLSKVGLNDLFGLVFFLCAYLAGLGASIGLMEASVSVLVDRKKVARSKSGIIIGLIAFSLCVVPAFSSNLLRSVQFSGMNLLHTFDNVLINWILPVIAIGISLAVGYRVKLKNLRSDFIWDERQTTMRLFGNWVFALRWIVPTLITIALSIEMFGILSRLL